MPNEKNHNIDRPVVEEDTQGASKSSSIWCHLRKKKLNHWEPHQYNIIIGEIGEELARGEVIIRGDAIKGGALMIAGGSLRCFVSYSDS